MTRVLLTTRLKRALLTSVCAVAGLSTAVQAQQTDRFREQQAQAAGTNQKRLTLQQCVDLALERNLTVMRAENSLQQAHIDELQSKLAYIPSLSASANFNRSFGTAFDQVTFARVERNTNTSSPQLFLSTPVFAGLGRYYTLRQNMANHDAATEGLTRTRNTVTQNVILAYLNVVFDQSNIDITRTRIKLLQSQYERTDKLYRAGSGTKFDVLNVQSQLAVEELNLINQQNTLRTDKIRLLQLIQEAPGDSLDGGFDFQAVDTAVVSSRLTNESLPPITHVEAYALENMPEIKESGYRMTASRYSQKFAFSRYFPTLTFNAGFSSSYSSNQREFDAVTGTFGGEVPYFTQLSENKSYFIGLSLNIPIFNGWQVGRGFQIAKIQYNNAQLDYAQAQNDLQLRVRQSYFDVLAAQEQQRSLQRQSAALNEAFTIAEAQYNAGTINFVQYLEALNNRSRIEQQGLQAIYNYYFRRKILDFFQGKPITF